MPRREAKRQGPTDDRGEPCGLAQLSGRQLGWRALGLRRLTPDVHTRSEQNITVGLETGVALVGGIAGAVLYQLVLYPVFSGWMTPWMFWLGFLIIPVVFSMIAWWLFLGKIRTARSTRIIEIYLAAGRCAACGYALADLVGEHDRCLVCPECNAAWLASRVGRNAGGAATTAE